MYDRAPRALTQHSNGTNESVGPGSYDPQRPQMAKPGGYAPFLSMTMRQSFLTVPLKEMAAPGPGQYDPSRGDRVKGGSTLANQSQRFEAERQSASPGPGSYTLSKREDWIKRKHGENEFRGCTIAAAIRLQDSHHNVLDDLKKRDAPSIPFPGQAYGFEEGEDGTLVKQKCPDRDRTLGPAFYIVKDEETAAARKYKGIYFGRLTSKRKGFKGNEGPGPGYYDPFGPKEKTPIDFVIEEQRKSSHDTKLPRYHEIIGIVEEKKAVPGPGKYDIKSQFNKPGPTPIDAVPRPAFGSQAKRFNNTKERTPAPGAYNDPRNSLNQTKRVSGAKQNPFGQTSTRFQAEHAVRNTPGPGAYNHCDLAKNAKKIAYLASARKGGFGSTSARTVSLKKKDEHNLPGPGHYTVSRPRPQTRPGQSSSVFASTTTRLRTPTPVLIENPPPGTYEVSTSYDRTQGRVLYPNSLPCQPNASQRGGFLSSSKRFHDNTLHPSSELIDNSTPAPGQYEVKQPSLPGGLLVTQQERFKPIQNDVPGPGAYEFSPSFRHSLLKGTFNATLDNPIATMIDQTEKETKTPVETLSILA